MATSAFGKAFRAARDSGDKEFEYEGKKYNTKLKEEDSAPAKKAAPAKEAAPAKDTSNYGNEGNRTAAPAKTESKSGGIGPYNAFSGVGDYLNRTFTAEGREQVRKENKEKSSFKKGGSVSASSRGDGIAQRGKTRGKMC
jgi:hypothetical protein